MNKKMEIALANANEACVAFDEALQKGDLHARNKAEKDAKEAIGEYKTAALNEALEELCKTDDPVREAILRKTYATKKFQIEKEKGVELGASVVDSTDRFDLRKVCTYAKKPTDWQYMVEKFCYLICLKTSKDINLEVERLQKMYKDYRITDIARKLDMGETPTSNTQVGKLMQQIFDALLPGVGKVRKEDINFCLHAADRYNDGGLKDAGVQTFHKIIVDCLHNILTGESYTMRYKVNKDADGKPADEKKDEAVKEVKEAPAA